MLRISSISDVVKLPFQIVFGAAHGTGSALYKGSSPSTFAGEEVYNIIGKFSNDNVSLGLTQIKKSHILDDLRRIFQKDGLKTFFNTLFSTEAAKAAGKAVLGLRGIGVLLVGGIVAALGVYFGSTLFMESWRKVTQLKQGKPADLVRNPWVHGAHGLTGLAMAVGGAMAFFPPTMIFGAGLAVSGFIGAMALHGVRYVMGGQHPLRYYEQLFYPFDKLAKKFTNKTNYYS